MSTATPGAFVRPVPIPELSQSPTAEPVDKAEPAEQERIEAAKLNAEELADVLEINRLAQTEISLTRRQRAVQVRRASTQVQELEAQEAQLRKAEEMASPIDLDAYVMSGVVTAEAEPVPDLRIVFTTGSASLAQDVNQAVHDYVNSSTVKDSKGGITSAVAGASSLNFAEACNIVCYVASASYKGNVHPLSSQHQVTRLARGPKRVEAIRVAAEELMERVPEALLHAVSLHLDVFIARVRKALNDPDAWNNSLKG